MRPARLGLALVACLAPALAAAQARPAPAGIELGLSLGRFPAWTATFSGDFGVGDRSFDAATLAGASLAVFPVRQLGVRAAVETTGLRFYSEDSGFDLWRLGVEVRPAAIGPVTVFANAGIGRLSHTSGIGFRLWNVGGGAQLKLIGAFSFLIAADLVWLSDPNASSPVIQRTEVDLDPIAWRCGLAWRIARFGR
jgi:hypothetical protein